MLTRGEVRSLPVYGPGGYLWMPQNGAEVLVIKGGPGGQEQCVAGMRQGAPEASMQPGEVLILSLIHILRTSAAAIFGYFLSANFIGHDEEAGQATATVQTHILKTGAGPVQDLSLIHI